MFRVLTFLTFYIL